MTNRAAHRDAAHAAWASLPKGGRGARRVCRALADQGIELKSTTVHRWIQEWEGIGDAVAKVVQKMPAGEGHDLPDEDLNDIPKDLRTVLPAHVIKMAKGVGLDRVENAITAVAARIQENAAGFVEDDEKLRTAAVALSTFATALLTIAQARAVVSMAHRNFAEGDRMRAEGQQLQAAADKLTAEAEEIRRGIPRADGAPTIEGEAKPVNPLADAVEAFHRAGRPANVS